MAEFGEDAIEKYWGTANKLNPFNVSKFRNTKNGKIFIKCQNNELHGEYEISCSEFINGNRCPICSGRKILIGFNDLATTNPELLKYFKDKNEATLVSKGSSKRILMRCPKCGFEKYMRISDLVNQNFSCNECGERVSYPNRFVTLFLKQLGVRFETEKNFKWGYVCDNDNIKLNGRKQYDHYIPSINCIVENHGLQHYEESFSSFGIKSLDEEQENDRLKEKLAKENGIEHYISLDCRYSEIKWIRNSIMNSELPKLLKFKESDIDWNKCEKYSSESNINVAAKMWNDGLSVKEIVEQIGVCRTSVKTYLKKASMLGLCTYNAEESKRRGVIIQHSNKV